MKTSFALLISIIAIGLSSYAGPNGNAKYFICNFSDTITTIELSQLKTQGFHVIEKSSSSHVIFVTAKMSKAIFSPQLKNKMKELIMVDEYGNRTQILETEKAPDLLNLFFNFI
tara:strand:- start:51735 stop:52076 length:342 start_codon:yes stop_codon:yes gene_type:complete